MIRFFVEDKAHKTIIDRLNFTDTIEICNGRSNAITRALKHDKNNNIGFIDNDNGVVHGQLKDLEWKNEDDFYFATKNKTMFIRFDRNVEEWLKRASQQYKTELPENFKVLHGNIDSKEEKVRKFLQSLIDAKPKPNSMILLRNRIRNHIK